jgi:hypothetical protein
MNCLRIDRGAEMKLGRRTSMGIFGGGIIRTAPLVVALTLTVASPAGSSSAKAPSGKIALKIKVNWPAPGENIPTPAPSSWDPSVPEPPTVNLVRTAHFSGTLKSKKCVGTAKMTITNEASYGRGPAYGPPAIVGDNGEANALRGFSLRVRCRDGSLLINGDYGGPKKYWDFFTAKQVPNGTGAYSKVKVGYVLGKPKPVSGGIKLTGKLLYGKGKSKPKK